MFPDARCLVVLVKIPTRFAEDTSVIQHRKNYAPCPKNVDILVNTAAHGVPFLASVYGAVVLKSQAVLQWKNLDGMTELFAVQRLP